MKKYKYNKEQRKVFKKASDWLCDFVGLVEGYDYCWFSHEETDKIEELANKLLEFSSEKN